MQENATLTVTFEDVVDTSMTVIVEPLGLDIGTVYIAEINVHLPDGSGVVYDEAHEFVGEAGVEASVTGLTAETEYEVSVIIYPTGGETVLSGDYPVTTTEVIVEDFGITMSTTFEDITGDSFKMVVAFDGLDENSSYKMFVTVLDPSGNEVDNTKFISFTGSNTEVDTAITGLEPETEYTCILELCLSTDDSTVIASDEATCTTTHQIGLDFSKATLEVIEVTPSSTSVFFRIRCSYFPSDLDGSIVIYRIKGTTTGGLTANMETNAVSGTSYARGTLSELTPETEYTVNFEAFHEGVSTGVTTSMTFTTTAESATPDFSEAYMEVIEVTPSSTSVFFRVGCYKFPMDTDDNAITFTVVGETSDGRSVNMENVATSGASFVKGTLNELAPETEYTVTFEAYYAGESTGVTVSVTFATLTESLFDRNSFLAGMAAGVANVAVSVVDVEQHSWVQGYIIGCGMRTFLVVSDVDAAWAEVIDGVLYIRRAYSASLTNNTLEVQ